MSKLHLVLAFHNHQPVGNFDNVLEECYQKSYLPFLRVLIDHPRIKTVLHYSGHLLSWMRERHAEATGMIGTLVNTKRAEILSGGFYEPILSVLPERDRMLQITEFSEFIKNTFGHEPGGMWLAERVWEPQMPRFISGAGIKYLPIDDYHFKMTGLEERDLFGYYITEDEGRRVSVFPGSERLRYYIPFRPVGEIIEYLREVHDQGGDRLLTMADDGEKFGVWPGTYKLCYEEGWLEDFFAAIEDNSDWLETTTFSEYHSAFPPLGSVYLPTASYREMGEWALPATAALEYERVLEELSKTSGERSKQLLRGSIWRAFMVKYPEANHLHKRMMMISGKVHEAADSRKSTVKGKKSTIKKTENPGLQAGDMLHELWRGQCNDAYWHGIFGGLYLPHLRSALYRHLLRAESAAHDILKTPFSVVRSDFDCDGFDDIVVSTDDFVLAATERGGSLTELSLRRWSLNLFDIISRKPEAYHSKIAEISGSGADATGTIHDRLSVKEAGLADYLIYDGYRRSSLIDRFLPQGTSAEDMARSRYEDLGDFAGGVYSMRHDVREGKIVLSLSRRGMVRQKAVKILKTITLGQGRDIGVEYSLEGEFRGLFAVEVNMSLLGSPLASIHAAGKTGPVSSAAVHGGIGSFRVGDGFLDLGIEFLFNESIDLWYYPVETISLSEQGIERLYQGTAFLFVLDLDLHGRKQTGFTLRIAEETS